MEAPYAPPAYKDRRIGLIIFGITLMVFGALCLLFVPLAVFVQVMTVKTTGQSNLRMILPSILVYAGMGVLFVTLGIGSIKSRRWARALTLVLCWAWLVTGAITIVMFVWIGPTVFHAVAEIEGDPLPPSALTVIILVGVCFFGVFFVLFPGLLILFYGSSNVKATVEAMDPRPRWTDACPLPVLGVSLLTGFAAMTLLTMPVAYNGALPLFGAILSGFAGGIGWLVLAALLGYAAWSIYRLRVTGWWIMVAVLAVFTVSNVITFSRVDLMDLYRRMGYPEHQLELFEKMNIFSPGQIVVWNVVCAISIVGYLIFIKKHFQRALPTRSAAI